MTSVAPGLVEAGVAPVICEGLTTVRLPTSLPPMVTLVTLMKLVPVTVTLVPPATRPLGGLTAVTVTGPASYVKQPLQVLLPWLDEVTTTSFAPELAAAGDVPVISVGLTTVRLP